MILERRRFLAALIAAPLLEIDYPKRKAKVVKLFKSPDGHPNAMETTAEGLWIGEQTTDRAHLLDWKGNLIRTVETESSNTSGIAFGAGVLWMAANGKAIGRPVKTTDATTGEVLKVDPANGKTLARYPIPGGGACTGWNLRRKAVGDFAPSAEAVVGKPEGFSPHSPDSSASRPCARACLGPGSHLVHALHRPCDS